VNLWSVTYVHHLWRVNLIWFESVVQYSLFTRWRSWRCLANGTIEWLQNNNVAVTALQQWTTSTYEAKHRVTRYETSMLQYWDGLTSVCWRLTLKTTSFMHWTFELSYPRDAIHSYTYVRLQRPTAVHVRSRWVSRFVVVYVAWLIWPTALRLFCLVHAPDRPIDTGACKQIKGVLREVVWCAFVGRDDWTSDCRFPCSQCVL